MSGENEEGSPTEQWKQQIPSGFRFCPTDQEILQVYLFRHVTGNYIPPGIISEFDVYKCNPYHLPGIDRKEEFTYFFTLRKRKHENGSRTNRVTRDKKGHWKSTSKTTEVFTKDGFYLGKKNTLVYYVKNPGDKQKDIKTNWIMHEFVLANNLVSASSSSTKPQQHHYIDVVACRIYERESNQNNRENQELKKLIISLIERPNPLPTDHNNGESQRPSKRKLELINTEALIFPCDQPHHKTMSYSNNYVCDSQQLQAATILLGNMSTNYEIEEPSNTNSTSPHDDDVVVTGQEGVSTAAGGSNDQTVYQNRSDEVKTEENIDMLNIFNNSSQDGEFIDFLNSIGVSL